MNKKDIIKIISDSYSRLSMDCQNDLHSKSEMIIAPKGKVLVKSGKYSDETFFILQGCARAYYLKDGRSVTDWFAFENSFISSINSFFLNIPSPHFIELLEDSILLKLNRKDVESLSDKYRDFERLTKIVVIKTMLQQQERIVSIQFHSAEEKYDSLLEIQSDITQRVPLTHIASYLGITIETLSRIRKRKTGI